jgi:hypothetical protein
VYSRVLKNARLAHWATLLALGLGFAPPASAQIPSYDRTTAADWAHLDLEHLYTTGAFEEGLVEAKAQLAKAPKDVDLYWHVARFLFEVGERYDRDAPGVDKETIYEEMLAVADRGLARVSDHPHVLFARGIAVGRLGTTRGIIASLFTADELESDWLRVANSGWVYSSLGGEEILPCDAYAALGILYRLVPDWWIIEVIAGMRGSLDKSLEFLARADDCSPDRIETLKEYAVIRMCYGERHDRPALIAAGIQDLKRVRTLVPSKPTDHIDLKHATMLLNDPSLACAYSRDGQAETDRSELAR